MPLPRLRPEMFVSTVEGLRLSSFEDIPVSTQTMEEEIDALLKDLDLDVKKWDLAQTLSGGQKRKLSVAIALIGKSKVGKSSFLFLSFLAFCFVMGFLVFCLVLFLGAVPCKRACHVLKRVLFND